MFMRDAEADNGRKDAKPDDRAWLERAYADLDKDYGMWTRDPHLAGQTGLSRYLRFRRGSARRSVAG